MTFDGRTSAAATSPGRSPLDADNDGLEDGADPCPGQPLNECFGLVALDRTAGVDIRINTHSTSTDYCSGVRTDCHGRVWAADFGQPEFATGYNHADGPEVCFLPNACAVDTTPVFGCHSESTGHLFQCGHWDRISLPELNYRFDVPDGNYLINLLFMNTYAGTVNPGERIFSVAVNGVIPPHLLDFDQVAAAGGACDPDNSPCTPVVRSVVVAVSSGEGLEIEFLGNVQRPAIKGIEVLRSYCDIDTDGDGSPGCDDCNDTDAGNRPGIVESCDGRDNDCDALIDNDASCDRTCGSPQWVEGEYAGMFRQLAWTGWGYGAVDADCGEGGWCWVDFFTMDPGGSPTTSRLDVDAGYNVNTDPALVWTGSEFGVTWTSHVDGSQSPRAVNFARLTDGGTQLGVHAVVATGAVGASGPVAAWNGSEYAIAWIEYDQVPLEGPTYRIRFTRVDRLGYVIATTQTTPDLSTADPFPDAIRDLSLVWTGSEYGMAWSDARDGDDEIRFARIDAQGNTLGAIQRITDANGPSIQPSLAWTGTGYGLVWSDDRGAGDAIYFAEIDASGNPGGEVNLGTGAGAPRLAWTGEEYGVGWSGHFARLLPPATLLDPIEAPTPLYLGWTGDGFGVSDGYFLDRIGCECQDLDGDGYYTCAGDCDDTDATAHPGAAEVCDGIDNDCSGQIDDPGTCDPGPYPAPSIDLFTDPGLSTPGLVGSYVDQNLWWYGAQDDWRLSQAIAGSRVDEEIDFTTTSWGSRAEVGLTGGSDADWDEFSVQWDGFVRIIEPQTRLATVTDDSSRMWIDLNHDDTFDPSGDEFVDNNWGAAQGVTEGPHSVELSPGVYRIRIQYNEGIYGNWAQLITVKPEIVRIAYIVPANRTPQPHAVERIRHYFGLIHEFYREQMERNGFASKSFRYETAPDGVTPIVHVVPVAETDEYITENTTGYTVWDHTIPAAAQAGVSVWHPGEIWFLMPETHRMRPDGTIFGTVYLGTGGSGSDAGVGMVSAETLGLMTPDALRDDTPYDGLVVPGIGPYPLVDGVSFHPGYRETISSIVSTNVGGKAHELGHTFGLPHDWRNDTGFHGNLMYNGRLGFRAAHYPDLYPSDDCRLAYSQALALSTNRYFVETPRLFSPVPPMPARNGQVGVESIPGQEESVDLEPDPPPIDCYQRPSSGPGPEDHAADQTKPVVTITTSGPVTPQNGQVNIDFAASDDVQLAYAFLHKGGDRINEMELSGTSVATSFATPYYDPDTNNTYYVMVFDGQGNRQDVSTVINPQGTSNRGPRPDFRLLRAVSRIGSDVILNAEDSSDPDSGLLNIEWDVDGDGTYDYGPSTDRTLTTQYGSEGIYPVRLRVTDPGGSQVESTWIPARILCAQAEESTWHLDLDVDGFGRPGTEVDACDTPLGYVNNAIDCDDVRAAVYPGAPEICDGLNNDCDHPAYPALQGTVDQDDDGDSFSECAGDCDDAVAAVYPAAPEACDGYDNDCDGTTDEDVPVPGEVTGLRLDDRDTLSWSDLEGPFHYALYRGSLGEGGIAHDHHCLQPDIAEALATDVEIPVQGFYYLVAGMDACGEGWLGAASDGQPRPSAGACTEARETE